jgi:transposase
MGMRGSDAASGALFSYVDMEAPVPATHPLRTIRTIVNEVLAALDTEFEALYEGIGRQSVAPERLLRALLLQAFYSVRSERQLMEQITGDRDRLDDRPSFTSVTNRSLS